MTNDTEKAMSGVTIEIGTCARCGHYPTQFIVLPMDSEPFSLHLPANGTEDCVGAETRRLVRAMYAQQERIAELEGQRDEAVAALRRIRHMPGKYPVPAGIAYDALARLDGKENNHE